MLKDWISSVDLILEFLISLKALRFKVLCLLYHYRHLNEIDFTNLLLTNLITHRVRIALNIKFLLNSVQKRHALHKKWWLRKIILNEIEKKIYEFTKSVNERFSKWNAKTVIIDKVKNSTLKNELRIIFDYLKIIKIFLETYVELSNKVHDNLSYLYHKCLFAANFKHAYLIILMYSKNQYFFTFCI